MNAKNLTDRFPHLTEREASVIALIAEGKGNADIASALGITEKTVKNVLTVVPGKIGLADDRGGSLRVRIALVAHSLYPAS